MAQFTCNFNSYTLRRAVTISAIVPSPGCPDYWDGGVCTHLKPSKYPVLYLLHGTGNDYSTWLRYTLIERYAEEHNIVVITISGENKTYVNRQRDKFFDFIQKELPEFVCANFPMV